MSKYTCPKCRGGFEELNDNCCPWCGTPMDGEYEHEPMVRSISKVEDDEEESRISLFKKLSV